MITPEEAVRYREELVAVLQEDVHNEERLLRRLDQIRTRGGIRAHAALLLILTRLPFEEEEARAHWEAILKHRAVLVTALQREVGVRVAALDYFVTVNRQLTGPRIIDLSLEEVPEPSSPIDRATGLWNARTFLGALQKETRRARRYDLGLCVLYIDLDDFRQINERHGDLVGGVLLREVGILIKNKIRDIDMAARVADEEFGVILPGSERMGAFLVAERIRQDIGKHFLRRDTDGKAIGMTITIGIAKYPEDATIADRLLERAEQAMHQAKARGGNSVGIYYRERRNFIRFDSADGPVHVRIAPNISEGKPETTPSAHKARNISRSGLLFESHLPYAIGVGLTVVCHDERDGARLTLPARVVRIEEIDGEAHRYEVGAVFLLEWEHQEAQVADFLRRGAVAAGA